MIGAFIWFNLMSDIIVIPFYIQTVILYEKQSKISLRYIDWNIHLV